MTNVGPETRLVNQIRKAIVAEYPSAFIMKVAGGPYQVAGIPDLLVVILGRLAGLEVKARRGRETAEHARARATPRQLACLAALDRAGAKTGVVTSVEEALRILKRNPRGTIDGL